MSELLLGLLVWIGAHTGYSTDVELPNVVMTTRHNMCALYGISAKDRCDSAELKGFYDKDLTIYLDTDFDSRDNHHRSRLLHELVHYVQWKNGRNKHACLGKLEAEAYELQDAWREENGLAPGTSPFKIILLAAACDP
jgi:hypothetical protein